MNLKELKSTPFLFGQASAYPALHNSPVWIVCVWAWLHLSQEHMEEVWVLCEVPQLHGLFWWCPDTLKRQPLFNRVNLYVRLVQYVMNTSKAVDNCYACVGSRYAFRVFRTTKQSCECVCTFEVVMWACPGPCRPPPRQRISHQPCVGDLEGVIKARHPATSGSLGPVL